MACNSLGSFPQRPMVRVYASSGVGVARPVVTILKNPEFLRKNHSILRISSLKNIFSTNLKNKHNLKNVRLH